MRGRMVEKAAEKLSQGLPGGPGVKNPPCNAGDTGLIPGQGTKIPHAKGQLESLAQIPRDSTKVPRATTKTWCSQINT